MLAKIWKKLFLIICIIAIIIDISHKMVNRTTVKEQLIELATTDSLTTSFKYFIHEKFGSQSDDEKGEYSNPVGEVIDVFKKDKQSSTDDSENIISNSAVDNENDDKINDVDAIEVDNDNDGTTDKESNGENKSSFTKIIQNMVDDMNDNAYLNDDPSDDLIYSGDPTF